MLDAWIIEEIRREEEKKQEQERPFLELPLKQEEYEDKIEEEQKRSVIKIQL